MKHAANVIRKATHTIRGELQQALFAIGCEIESEEREDEKKRGRLAINNIILGLIELEVLTKELDNGKD